MPDREKPGSRAENPDCPCGRKGCPRHGKCGKCRRHHEKDRYPLPCEKKRPTGREP